MELHQLEYVLAVAEEAGFTRAAERLRVAQPGISTQVRRLERELGQPLFNRSGRTVRLTDAGRAVLPYARAALDAVAGARAAVDELTGLVRGQVTIGTIVATSREKLDMPAMLAAFHRAHPGIRIALHEDDSEPLLAGLLEGRYDLALAALPGPLPPGLSSRTVIDEQLVVAVAPDDRLARRQSVPVGALRGRTLVSLPMGTGLRAAVERACAAAGFRADVAFEAGDPAMAAHLAAHGLGVAVLPLSVVEQRPDLRVLTLRPRLTGQVALAWRETEPVGPATGALVAHVRAWLDRAEASEAS